jgi:hypothetical protein
MILLHEGAFDVHSWAGTNWPARDSPTVRQDTFRRPPARLIFARLRALAALAVSAECRLVPGGTDAGAAVI